MYRAVVALLVLAASRAPALAADAGASKLSPAAATQLANLGDECYREGRFEDARAAFERALDVDPNSARARLGLGRIARLLTLPDEARAHFSKAFQASPADPDAVLAFASVVDGEARQALLRNFLVLNRDERNTDVSARLLIERGLAGRTPGVVDDPQRSYQARLKELGDNGRPAGLGLQARINGGPPLDLLLDSAAKGLVLNSAAARNAGVETLSDAAVFGFGVARPAPGRVALAARVEVGALVIHNVLLAVSSANLVPHADGLISPEVFQDFLVRIDARSHRLELNPVEDGRECKGYQQAYSLDSLLLLRVSIKNRVEGNFVLDTGSAVNLVADSLASGNGHQGQLAGAQGGQRIAWRPAPFDLLVGNQNFQSVAFAATDLNRLSNHYGTAIAGVIGYPLLRDTTLEINYRRGLVKLSQR
jgi:tetratricopeptide (TPR) repeat protein